MLKLPRFHSFFIIVTMTVFLSACQGDNKQKVTDEGSIIKNEQSENTPVINSKKVTPLREVIFSWR